MLSLGVDVGVRKGLDVVALDASRTPVEHLQGVSLDRLAEAIGRLRPDVVAIDSPPGWARGGRSRAAERALGRLGISSYAAPTADRGSSHPFYEWMRVGFEVFRVAEELGYPRYREGPVAGTAVEVFPHATAVALAGCLPPRGQKLAWRTALLEAAGVPVGVLRSADLVDAALGALTTLMALEGPFVPLGDPDEGVIVLPVAALPQRFSREAPPASGGGGPSGRPAGRAGVAAPRR